jgi:DNA helicase-2/ATP-dependent DNA helicase PcrA
MYGNWVSAIPSRFVDELPAEHIEAATDPGLYGPGRSSHWDSSGFQAETRLRERKVVNEAGTTFRVGDRVFHDKFGYGGVIHIDGHKLDINFDTGGHKRVMDSFVEKA